jgi:hypothetical protein
MDTTDNVIYILSPTKPTNSPIKNREGRHYNETGSGLTASIAKKYIMNRAIVNK